MFLMISLDIDIPPNLPRYAKVHGCKSKGVVYKVKMRLFRLYIIEYLVFVIPESYPALCL